MLKRLRAFVARLDLAQKFMLGSLVILVGGAIGLGEWVAHQIESGVVHRTAATTALFVDSFIDPNLQELAYSDSLTPAHILALNRLTQEPPMNEQIAAFKVWDASGRVIYSSSPEVTGQVFPITEGLAQAWKGQVSARVSQLDEDENLVERTEQDQLLEVYSPVSLGGTDRIIAVAEFYQRIEPLQQEVAAARRRSWLIVALVMGVMYLLLAGFVGRASDTIRRQQTALGQQVDQLTELLAQNESLHDRVRRAAARTAALNERVLRRISAELHDGPVQDIGLALLRLDMASAQVTANPTVYPPSQPMEENLNIVQESLQRALGEIRALSAGLGVPRLNAMTLSETAARVVREHEQRTHTSVNLLCDDVPEQASLPVKIALYRLVQEALNNAFRHAAGLGQKVEVRGLPGQLSVVVLDQGPGFDPEQQAASEGHLGMVGMRERVESLGGTFRVESAPGQGARISALLPLQEVEDHE